MRYKRHVHWVIRWLKYIHLYESVPAGEPFSHVIRTLLWRAFIEGEEMITQEQIDQFKADLAASQADKATAKVAAATAQDAEITAMQAASNATAASDAADAVVAQKDADHDKIVADFILLLEGEIDEV